MKGFGVAGLVEGIGVASLGECQVVGFNNRVTDFEVAGLLTEASLLTEADSLPPIEPPREPPLLHQHFQLCRR